MATSTLLEDTQWPRSLWDSHLLRLTVEPHESQVEEPSPDGGKGLLHLSPRQENKCLGRKFPFENDLLFEGNIFLSYFLRGNLSAISERKIFLLPCSVCYFDS